VTEAANGPVLSNGPSGLSRRSFLLGAAGAGLLSLAETAGGGVALAAPAAPPGMPSPDDVWSWQHRLVEFGTRYTANPGHVRFVEWLAARFSAVPGMHLHTDRKTFHRWLARDWSLSVRQPGTVGPSGRVPVTYYYPYSGFTPPGGVSAPLVDLGTYPPAAPGTSTGGSHAYWLAARGKIALVHAPASTASLDGPTTATGGYEPGRSSSQAAEDYTRDEAVVTNPAWNGIFSGVPLADAAAVGVKGVIVAWSGMPDAEVVNQYNPFITPYAGRSGSLATKGDPGCPALWVGEATGRALSHSAASGLATATLTLTADITEHAATETLWGVLRGSGGTGENLIVNTHTDGPNATEENGALGMLAMAQYFARRRRNRDLYFVLVTGHFQLPQFTTTAYGPTRGEVGSDATSVWLADHKSLWQHTQAGITVEHLGCTRWGNVGGTGAYRRLAGYEWGATMTCQKEVTVSPTNTEEQAYLAAVRAVNRSGWRNTPVATIQPTPLYLGEGAPLYAAGLGTVSLIPLPPYLLQAGTAAHPGLLDLELLDKNLMYAQILTLARTVETLDRAPTSAF
jgi:hypothetical protein